MINFGIEIELEQVYFDPPRGWRRTEDGTLRHDGYEYLFSDKRPLGTTRRRMREFIDHASDYPYHISHRCSMHIHTDIMRLSKYQRMLYFLMLVSDEEYFFGYNENRKHNPFCCPLLYSPSLLLHIDNVFHSYDYNNKGTREVTEEQKKYSKQHSLPLKYSSLNTDAMNTLGSLELRHFSPIMNYEEVSFILDRIVSHYEYARYKEPTSWMHVARDLKSKDIDKEAMKWVRKMYISYMGMRNKRVKQSTEDLTWLTRGNAPVTLRSLENALGGRTVDIPPLNYHTFTSGTGE